MITSLSEVVKKTGTGRLETSHQQPTLKTAETPTRNPQTSRNSVKGIKRVHRPRKALPQAARNANDPRKGGGGGGHPKNTDFRDISAIDHQGTSLRIPQLRAERPWLSRRVYLERRKIMGRPSGMRRRCVRLMAELRRAIVACSGRIG